MPTDPTSIELSIVEGTGNDPSILRTKRDVTLQLNSKDILLRQKVQKTFLMIKPDAVQRNLTGEILRRAEKAGFEILEQKMVRLSPGEAKRFYAIHKGKPFYDELVKYVSSGEVVAVLVRKKNAVKDLRELIGSTDPKRAKKGTIRRDLAINTTKNSVHASDSLKNAKMEIEFFF